MALEKLLIGDRIRLIREDVFEDSRKEFANRCDLNERYVGQLERGEFLLSLKALDKISVSTGTDADYILYGNRKRNIKHKSKMRENLIHYIENAEMDEIKVIYNSVFSIVSYMNKKKINKKQ